MGIWAGTLCAWQQCTTSRPSESSCSHECDKRTTSTTFTSQHKRNTHICRSEDNNHGVLKDHNGVLKTPTTLVLSRQHKPWRRPSSNGHWGNIQRQRKRKRKEQRKRIWQGQQRKRIPTRKRLGKAKEKQQPWYQPKGGDKGNKGKAKGMPNKGKGKNPTAVCYRCGQPGHMAKDCRTAVYNMSETPQEQDQDGKAQWYDPNKGYDNYWYSNDQSGNYNTHPVQRSATTSFTSTTYRQSNTINPLCGNTGPSGRECPQGSNSNYASSSTTKRRHRGRDHDRQRCSNTCLPNMVCTRHTIVSITTWTRSEAQDSNRCGHPSAWLQMGVHA